MNDICGKDWVREGGDHGDPDLELAISQLKGNDTKHSVPLVVFGHMHKELAFGNGPRKMIAKRGHCSPGQDFYLDPKLRSDAMSRSSCVTDQKGSFMVRPEIFISIVIFLKSFHLIQEKRYLSHFTWLVLRVGDYMGCLT